MQGRSEEEWHQYEMNGAAINYTTAITITSNNDDNDDDVT